MGEYDDSRSRGPAIPVTANMSYDAPPRTPDERARDAFGAADRELASADHARADVEHASSQNDRGRWESAHARLGSSITAVRRALDRARTVGNEAPETSTGRLAAREQRLVSLEQTTAQSTAPNGYVAVSHEDELLATLMARPMGSAKIGFQRKEAAIKELLDRLSPAESRALLARFTKPMPGDELAAAFNNPSSLAPERRHRMVEFLQGARAREARRVAATTRSGRVGPQPLPADIRPDLEAATGVSLSHVRVHADEHGARVAAQHGARAVAIGDDIHMGDGQLDGADRRELLAHEVAHVRQAAAHPGPAHGAAKRDVDDTTAAEREADGFASMFVRHGAAAAFIPTVGVAAGTAMLAPATAVSHDAFEAAMDNRVAAAARAGENLNAAAYLHLNMRDARAAVRDYLFANSIALGNPQVSFGERGFAGFVVELLAPLAGDDDSAHVRALRRALGAENLDALVDRSRAIFEAAKTGDTAEYTRGAKGPAMWRSPVGVAIGAAVAVAVTESFARMVPRLIARTALLRKETANPHARLPSGGLLVPSAPIDVEVARAMVDESTVEVAVGAAAAARTTTRPITSIEWQGLRGGPWNAVRVQPTDATTEDVAAAVIGTSADAYRVRQIGTMFVIPDDVAITHPEALAANVARGSSQPAETQIAFGEHVGEHIDAEAVRGMATTPASSIDPVALLKLWSAIEEQLVGLESVVAPLGFPAQLAPTMAIHAQRKSDFATLTGPTATVRAAGFEQQRELLARIAGEIGPVASQIELAHARSGAQDPLHELLGQLVHAASLSHLPETAGVELAHVHATQQSGLFDALAAELGRAATQIELAASAPRASENASVAVFGDDLRGRAEAMSSELGAMRLNAAKHAGAPKDLQDLLRRIEALRTDAQMVAQIGSMTSVMGVLDQLLGTGWVAFSEAVTARIDTNELAHGDTHNLHRLDSKRRAAAMLRTALEQAHGKWLGAQAHAQAIGNAMAVTGAANPAETGRLMIEAEIAEIESDLKRQVGANSEIAAFVQDAYAMAKSAQHRAMIAQIGVLIGVMIVSEGVGSAAEGMAVGEAATASIARGVASKIVGVTINSATFTVLEAALMGTPILDSFASNFIGNMATIGAMHGTRSVLSASAMGKTAGKAGAILWAAKAINIAAPMLVAVAVQFVQQEAEAELRNGRALSWDELTASGIQTVAMMIGSAVAHHALAEPMAEATEFGRDVTARAESRRRVAHLKALATKVTERGEPGEALALLDQTRAYLEDQIKANTDALASGTLDAAGAIAARKTNQRATSELAGLDAIDAGSLPAQLALDTVVPGHVYAGSEAAVGSAVASYRTRGYDVNATADGYVAAKPGEASLRFIAREGGERAAVTEPDKRHAPTPPPRSAGAAGPDLHTHIMGVTDAGYFVDKLGGGDAVVAFDRIHDAVDAAVAADPKLAKSAAYGWKIVQATRATLEASTQAPPAQRAAIARTGLTKILVAGDGTAFDLTYPIRQIVVETLIDPGGGAYRNFTRDTLAAESAAGVQYAEYSIGLGKVDQNFPAPMMRDVQAELAKQGVHVDVRILAMVNTKALAGETNPGDVGRVLTQLKAVLNRGDAIGVDIAGPEKGEFTAAGMDNFEQLYATVATAAKARGRALVLRPHVGEGYDAGDKSHLAVARNNLEVLIGKLENMHYSPDRETATEGKVLIRFGHATHATGDQLARIATLGVIVEANIGSNLTTHSVASLDDHPLLYNLYYGVETVLGTDGGGVMRTSRSQEYAYARRMIGEYRKGKTALLIDGREVRFGDLTEQQAARFSIEKIQNAEDGYHQHIVAGDRVDNARDGGLPTNTPGSRNR